jgi:hypothetical protein
MLHRRTFAPTHGAAPEHRLLNVMTIGDGILFLPFFTTLDARHLRGVCCELRNLVTNFAWDDRDPESHLADRTGGVRLWRTCFPRAVACVIWVISSNRNDHFNLTNTHITDSDLQVLQGVHYLVMQNCHQVTDAGFVHLSGVRTLSMSNCEQETITDAAFAHLTSIHTLDMDGCRQETISDAAFAHLASIHTLNMEGCTQVTITDAAFAHLAGIHTLEHGILSSRNHYRCRVCSSGGHTHLEHGWL